MTQFEIENNEPASNAVIVDPVQQRVSQDVQKFDLNDQKITELYDKYGVLSIKDHTDKEGYEILSKARKDVKAIRVAGDKLRKSLNEEANAYVKGVNSYWKTLEGKLETLEEGLSEKEEFYLKEKQRIKDEEDAAKRLVVEKRNAQLIELGFAFNGSEYSFDDGVNPVVNINSTQIENAPAERWESFVAKATDMITVFRAKEAERLRLEEIEAERIRKEEEEKENQRLAEEKAERLKQEAIAEANRKESERLENIRKEQEKKELEHKEKEEKLLQERLFNRVKSLNLFFDATATEIKDRGVPMYRWNVPAKTEDAVWAHSNSQGFDLPVSFLKTCTDEEIEKFETDCRAQMEDFEKALALHIESAKQKALEEQAEKDRIAKEREEAAEQARIEAAGDAGMLSSVLSLKLFALEALALKNPVVKDKFQSALKVFKNEINNLIEYASKNS